MTKAGEMVVAGGCYNKDGNPLLRSFYGDVWVSKDQGLTWTEMTPQAEWKARSGPRLVQLSSNGNLLLVAGEIGFTNSTQLEDIWASADLGASWHLVTAQPGFSPRSGHGVVVLPETSAVIVIAGWPHLHDVWHSADDGKTFTQLSDAAWNCSSDNCGKYDFWTILHDEKIYTIGGSAAYSTFGQLWQDTWVWNTTQII